MRQFSLLRVTVWPLAFVVALFVAGCTSSDPDPITSIPQVSSFAPVQDEYRLQTGDNLKIVVLGQEAISGDYVIDANGNADVSNVGLVSAAGLTVSEMERRIADKLRNGLVETPQVSVLLDAKRPVFVSGAVMQPGEYTYSNGMDARAAIRMAGGYAGNASRAIVYITKAGTSVETAHPVSNNQVIAPGDIVRVPRG